MEKYRFGKPDKIRKNKWKSGYTETMTPDTKTIFRLYFKKTSSYKNYLFVKEADSPSCF